MTRLAIYLQDAHPIRQGIEIVQYAESRGFEAVWQAESRLVREATVPMAAFLTSTERIKAGSGVVNNWTRNPALLASTFATLDDLAPGRVILGIGAWWDPLAAKVGVDRPRPLKAMRETCEAVRALRAQGEIVVYALPGAPDGAASHEFDRELVRVADRWAVRAIEPRPALRATLDTSS